MKRDFDQWLATFRKSIYGYEYYVDFPKIFDKEETLRVPLNILNSLVGSRNIREDFLKLIQQYPEVLPCIPILLAVRHSHIHIQDTKGVLNYKFSRKISNTPEEYACFMEKTGLFSLISQHIIRDLRDYVTGVEVGLDSNARKNRGGVVMENLVEDFIQKAGFLKDKSYFHYMNISTIQERFGIDMSLASHDGKTEKCFDFVVKTDSNLYVIETNFYGVGGSKLNETARSYKTLAQEIEKISGVTFVWFTDGQGWNNAKHNLEETFDVLETIYNIHDLEMGICKRLFL